MGLSLQTMLLAETFEENVNSVLYQGWQTYLKT